MKGNVYEGVGVIGVGVGVGVSTGDNAHICSVRGALKNSAVEEGMFSFTRTNR